MQEQLEVKNFDNRLSKSIWDAAGRRLELPPLARRMYPKEVARKFMDQHPKWVRPYEETPIPTAEGEDTVWIANMSGSELFPAEVEVIELVNGVEHRKLVPNPLREPTVLEFKVRPGQLLYGPDDDRKKFQEAQKTIRLEPYRRYALPRGYADTIVNRAHNVPNHLKGRVQYCDEGAPYEPNETWPLNDVREYARIVDSTRFTDRAMAEEFPSEEMLREKKELNQMETIKENLLHALFPRLVSDRFSKPNMEEFEAIKAQAAKPQGGRK